MLIARKPLASSRHGMQSRANDENMNQKPEDLEEDDIPETDFSGGVRGKYYKRYQEGTNVVLLEADQQRCSVILMS